MSAPSCPPIACPLQRAWHSHLCRAAPAAPRRRQSRYPQDPCTVCRTFRAPAARHKANARNRDAVRARSTNRPVRRRVQAARAVRRQGHAALQAPEARRVRRSGMQIAAFDAGRHPTGAIVRSPRQARRPLAAGVPKGSTADAVQGGRGRDVAAGYGEARQVPHALDAPRPGRCRRGVDSSCGGTRQPRRRDPVERARGRRKTKKSSWASCLRTAI